MDLDVRRSGALVTGGLGQVQSLRVFYRNGTEVEFGIAGLDWAAIPPDRGTLDVLSSGSSILLDRDASLRRVMQVARDAGPTIG